MSKRQFVGNLEFEENESFEKREHLLECAGWTVMLLIVLAGLAGAFGKGKLSQKEINAGSLKVEYQQFLRHSTPSEMKLQVQGKNGDEHVIVSLDKDYFEKVRVDDISVAGKIRVNDEAEQDIRQFVYP